MLKRTRIEVICVNRRVVLRSVSDAQNGSNKSDIDLLLSVLGEIAPPAELRHEMNEGDGEIIRSRQQPLRLRLSLIRRFFSQRFKTKRSS